VSWLEGARKNDVPESEEAEPDVLLNGSDEASVGMVVVGME